MDKKKRCTDFEWMVYAAALSIPLGKTRSYQWIAKKIGRPQSARAVGQALRKNPYPLLIPCHRVIKADGSLGAYAGKYDNKKKQLLALEGEIAACLSGKKKKVG